MAVTGATALGDGVEAFSINYYSYTSYTDELTNTLTSAANGALINGGAPKNVLKDNGFNVIAYKVIAVIEASENYTSYAFAPQNLKITKATIAGITMSSVEVVYDGESHSVAISAATTSLGDAVDVVYSITSGGIAIAGNSARDVLWDDTTVAARIVTATVTSYNYDDLVLQATLKITPLYVTGSWTDLSGNELALNSGVAQFTYNGALQGVKFTPMAYWEDSARTVSATAPDPNIAAEFTNNDVDVRPTATNVYLVAGVATAMTARVVGFTTNEEITINYVMADSSEQAWIINRRDVTVTFNNMIQSWTQNAWVMPTLASNSYSVVNTGATYTSLEATSSQVTAMQTEIDGIFSQNSYTITMSAYPVDHAARHFAAYQVNVDDVMTATLGANYNLVTNQRLIVSELPLTDGNNDYHFNVGTKEALAIMENESNALHELGIADSVYTQTANISGAANGSYVIYDEGAVVGVLYGSYNGAGYTLSDFMIVGNGEQVGFFGEVTGTITGVNLRYVTVISTGADAVVGAIAAKANEIATSSAQGHVYTSDDSTVGFLAGETTGAVTGSAAVGYVKVKGGDVTVGGAVGKASANVSLTNVFVEVNKIAGTATVNGIVGNESTGAITNSKYLTGSLGAANATSSNGGSATAYADMVQIQTIHDMIDGFVVKDFYVATMAGAYTIYNYRQLAIMEMYSWATYTLGADIELPYSYGNGVHAGEYVYSAVTTGGYHIYSSASGTFMGIEEVVR